MGHIPDIREFEKMFETEGAPVLWPCVLFKLRA
jgi:hypothetical protein